MKKNIILPFCFFFCFFAQVYPQTYLSEIKQSKRWKKILTIDSSINNLLELKITLPSQRIPEHIYQPSFSKLIDSSYNKLIKINIVFPKTIAIKNEDKINSYFQQLKKGNSLALETKLEKIASSSSLKNQLIALWLAQINYQKNNLAKSQMFLNFAYLSENNEIALQAEYLQALIYFKTKKYQKIKLQIKNWKLSYKIPIPQKFDFLELFIAIKEGKYNQVLQKIKKLEKTKLAEFALVKALLHYKLHQYQNAYKNLQKIRFSNYQKSEQQEIYYLQLWVSFFAKYKKEYQRVKKIVIKNAKYQNKQELAYLFLIEKMLSNKPVYKKINALASPSLRLAGLLLLAEQNLLTKPQRNNFFKNDIFVKNSPLLFYYNTKKSAYLVEKQAYFQALDYLFAAQYQAELYPLHFEKEKLTKLNLAIGITYLLQNNTKKAEEVFTNWKTTNGYFALVNYYLAYIYYKQINPQRMLQLVQQTTPQKTFATELLFFRAWANYRLGKKKIAMQILQKNNKNLVKSLLYGIYFQKKDFQKIIQSYNPKAKTTYNVDKFYILSLVKEQKPLLALAYLEKNNKQANPLYYQLYLEVLLANELYQKTVAWSSKNIKEHQKSFVFTTYLAQAFFLLKEYEKSLQYLETSQILHSQLPNINYNNLLNIVFLKTNLVAEIKLLQKAKKNTHRLFQKNLLLASKLAENLQQKTELQLYRDYLKQNSYKKVTMQLLIQRNLYLQSYFELCLKYGEYAFQGESEKEKQDRQILNSYCAQNAQIAYPIELNYKKRKNKQYREHSWRLIELLASKKERKILSNKLNLLEKQYYFIYFAKEALLKENPSLALATLKKASNDVFFSENEKQIYLLKANAYLIQNKKKQAINHLIKLLYASQNQETQVILIFKILPLLLAENWHQDAKQILSQINKDQLPAQLQKQYLQIVANILLAENTKQ